MSIQQTAQKGQTVFHTECTHATSTDTRHPNKPPNNKSLTFTPKQVRPSIIRILSGREFSRGDNERLTEKVLSMNRNLQ
ncbi:hypothetical protein J6590_033355 [Homalodisca vitripennis]|nr:hypothetical protein J6590_033355 [Homalodisca vitripennis]